MSALLGPPPGRQTRDSLFYTAQRLAPFPLGLLAPPAHWDAGKGVRPLAGPTSLSWEAPQDQKPRAWITSAMAHCSGFKEPPPGSWHSG